jgi:SAM-dependent methyltransferase
MSQPDVNAMELVRNLIHGRWKAQCLDVTMRLGIADVLDGEARSVPEIATELGVSEDGLGRLMRLMAALGVFTQEDDSRFRNNDASCLLRPDHPGSMLPEARQTLSPAVNISWDNLEHSVRTGRSGFEHAMGRTVFDYFGDHPEEAEINHRYYIELTRYNVPVLMSAYSFPASGTVIDVAGGTGQTLIGLLQQNSGLRGMLYDIGVTVDTAAETLAGPGAPVADRLTAVVGDMFTSVPSGGDVYLLNNIPHDWPDDRVATIFSNIAAAMSKDSEFVMMDILRPEGCDFVSAYLDVLFLTGLNGKMRTSAELSQLLVDAGLRVAAVEESNFGGMGIAVFTARKAQG